MESMHRIKEMLMKELKEYESKGKLSAGDLETIHKLTDTVKNIDKIEMLESGEGYSEDGMSYDGGMWRARGSYDSGYSERRRRDNMGRYTSSYDSMPNRDGGSYRGGRSYDGAKEHLMRKLGEMMPMAESEEQRKALEHCMRKIEDA